MMTVIVPQTEEVEDTLSNRWGVVALAGISNSGLMEVRAILKLKKKN
jgi:hypothetical protein